MGGSRATPRWWFFCGDAARQMALHTASLPERRAAVLRSLERLFPGMPPPLAGRMVTGTISGTETKRRAVVCGLLRPGDCLRACALRAALLHATDDQALTTPRDQAPRRGKMADAAARGSRSLTGAVVGWAGAESSTTWTGYMEGALASAERAAAEVRYWLRVGQRGRTPHLQGRRQQVGVGTWLTATGYMPPCSPPRPPLPRLTFRLGAVLALLLGVRTVLRR